MLDKALAFAIEKHKGQKRKSWSLPYSFHIVEVTYQLGKLGVEDDLTLCAALLHDTLEDTQTTFAELEKEFSEAIANTVEELTCMEDIDKVSYILSLEKSSVPALVIKLMDRTCNINDCLAAGKKKWAKNMFRKGVDLWDFMDARQSEFDEYYGFDITTKLVEYFDKKRNKFERL